jgi:hypothetical protein
MRDWSKNDKSLLMRWELYQNIDFPKSSKKEILDYKRLQNLFFCEYATARFAQIGGFFLLAYLKPRLQRLWIERVRPHEDLIFDRLDHECGFCLIVIRQPGGRHFELDGFRLAWF